MQIFLDDQPYDVAILMDTTVGQILEQVLLAVRSQGRVVTAIRCNGAEVGPGELEKTLKEPAGGYARLDFVSGTAGALVIDALSRIQAMLMELEPTRGQVVDFLDQGQTVRAMELLKPYFETWRQAHEAVQQSAALLRTDLTALSLDGRSITEIFSRFAEQLRQLKEAFEAKDMVTLADTMKYEAGLLTQQWIDLIELVKQEAEGK